MRSKLTLPIGISIGAALLAQLEGTLFALWAADHSPECGASSPAAACSLNATIAVIAGAFFAVETLAATLVALVLFRGGKRFGAAVTAAALIVAFAIQHLWLLGPSA